MNKSVNLVLRIVGVVAAIAACVFAYLLKGKIETATQNTAWTTTDAEILANKQFDLRMVDINTKAKSLLEAKRTKITELEGNVKDLTADVADKKQKIEGLTANVTTLEGERAELTRKRDELNGQLTEANSKKDSLTAELNSAKEELAKDKEKIAALFTKEQLDAEIAKANKAEENRNAATQKYVQLYNWTVATTGNKPPYPRDPLLEEKAGEVQVEFGPETIKTRIVVIDPSKGLVSFSVGELNGIKPQDGYYVRIGTQNVGQVRVEAVQSALSTAQILPGAKIEAFTRGGVVTLVPFTGKIANK
jgi:osmotically-inducible protein OsmY